MVLEAEEVVVNDAIDGTELYERLDDGGCDVDVSSSFDVAPKQLM